MDKYPIVLIYKRTHRGDPSPEGIFGINDCMGSVRDRDYDAVVGIGGVQPWVGDEGIARKINWIGISPKKYSSIGRGALVAFSQFCLFDENGPFLEEIAPSLYKHMFIDSHRRVIMSTSLTDALRDEVVEIVGLAANCPSSTGMQENCELHTSVFRNGHPCR